MHDVCVYPRREWTEEDDAKFSEYVLLGGFETMKLRIEKMICEENAELIARKNIDCIPKIEALSTLLRICDNARNPQNS